MPDPLNLTPPAAVPVVSLNETNAKDMAYAEERAASFGEGVEAVLNEGTGPTIFRLLERSGAALTGPAYKLDRDRLKALTDGVDEEFWSAFETVDTEEEAMVVRNQGLDRTYRKRVMGDLGWKGSALQLVGSLTDPGNVLVGLATGGVGSGIQAAGRAGRLAYLAKAGLAAGVPFAGLEYLKSLDNPAISGKDITMAGLSGGGFGWGHAMAGNAAWYTRGLYSGLGSAAPLAADDVLHGKDIGDIFWNAATALAVNGTFGAIAKGHDPIIREMHAKTAEVGVQIQKDVEATDLRLTAKSPDQFAALDMPEAKWSEHLKAVAEAERGAILQSFDTAAERLAAFAEDHKLNRSEVNSVMEGTGYIADSQGFPTPEQMRFNIKQLKDQAAAATDLPAQAAAMKRQRDYFEQQTTDALAARAKVAFAPIVETVNRAHAVMDTDAIETGGQSFRDHANIKAPAPRVSVAAPVEVNAAETVVPPGGQAKPVMTFEFDPNTGVTHYITPPTVSEKGTTNVRETSGPVREVRFGVDSAIRGRDFHAGLAETRRAHRFGAAVEVKPPEFYQDPANKLFIAADGSAGVAVTASGDLVSVFKKPGSTADINPILAEAASHARTLDGFDIGGKLPDLYGPHGFRPAARIPFNREFAPAGWDFAKMGEPDVVLMVRDPAGRSGLPEVPSKADGGYASIRDQVPVFSDYDAAVAAQLAAAEKGGGAASQAHVAAQGQKIAARAAMDAHIEKVDQNKIGGDIFLKGASDAPNNWKNRIPFLRGMAETVGNSKSAAVRFLNNMLGFDPVPRQGKNKATVTAREQAEMIHRGRYARYDRLTGRAYSEYVQAEKAAGRKPMGRRAFYEEVTKQQRRFGTPDYTANPFVDRAVKASIELHEHARSMNQRHEAPGWDQIEGNWNYVHRLKNQRAVDELAVKHETQTASGRHNLEQVVYEAIALHPSNSTMPHEITENIAIAWLDDMHGRLYEGDNGKTDILDPDQRGRLVSILRKKGVSEQVISDALSLVKPKDSGPTTGIAMKRIPMLETHGIDLPTGRLNLEDLLVNDNRVLTKKASRTGAGISALSEVGRMVAENADAIPHTIDGILHEVQQKAIAEGLRPEAYERDLAFLKTMLEMTVYGHRLQNSSTAARIADILGNMLGAKFLSGVPTGLAQVNAFGDTMATAGWNATTRAIPEVGTLWKEAVDGTLANASLKEAEFMAGIGGEGRSRHPLNRDYYDASSKPWMSTAHHWSAKAMQWAARVSLMEPILTGMNHLGGEMLVDAWHSMAIGKIEGFSDTRLLGMDLTPAMRDRIYAGINKHATMETGPAGLAKVASFNYHDWADAEAASRLRNAISREVNRSIGDMDQTAIPDWASRQGFKMFAAFRGFMFMAARNKLAHTMSMRDFKAAVAVTTSSAIAGSVFIAQTYLKSLGRPDADEYREKMLTGENIGKAMFSRADFASWLPALVDTSLDFSDRDPIFSYARSTDISGGLVKGVPAVSWGISAGRGLSGAAQAAFADDYELSQDDVNNWTDALFVPKAFNFPNIIQQWSQSLPKHSMVK